MQRNKFLAANSSPPLQQHEQPSSLLPQLRYLTLGFRLHEFPLPHPPLNQSSSTIDTQALNPSPTSATSLAMVVYALIIINKAGGLVYHRDFNSPLNKLTINDYLVLAGTFHGIHAITARLTPPPLLPVPPPGNPPNTPAPPPRSLVTGLEVLETSIFRLTCFQTYSGTKFLLFTENNQPNVEGMMRRVYEVWCDAVMKNPFYTLEMPVRGDGFERGVARVLGAR